MSTTFTLKLHCPGFSAASVALQVTGVVPAANSDPDAGEQVTATVASQLSVAEAVKVAIAEHFVAAALSVRSPGHVSPGGSLSCTVTVKEHSVVTPAVSVAVQVTGVLPMGNAAPDGGAHVTVAAGSLAVAE